MGDSMPAKTWEHYPAEGGGAERLALLFVLREGQWRAARDVKPVSRQGRKGGSGD